jgi:acetyl-CoA acetyltransferase
MTTLTEMGEASELIADKYDLTREDLDQYALMSHQRAFESVKFLQ